mgnify:CR=1 FL=1
MANTRPAKDKQGQKKSAETYKGQAEDKQWTSIGWQIERKGAVLTESTISPKLACNKSWI